jgi:Uma2 family endonuclease
MLMAIALQDTTQRIILPKIRWETYQALLTDLADRHAVYMTYDQGTLELMAPSYAHEETNRILATIVEAIVLAQDRDLHPAGSTTLTREDIARGFEPDSCFYLAHATDIRGKPTIDLTMDPPPDLVIEIDITSTSLDKLSLYAAVRVPEVWRYDGEQVTIYHLQETTYTRTDTSVVLSPVTSQQLTAWLRQQRDLPYPVWFQTIQQQIRANA